MEFGDQGHAPHTENKGLSLIVDRLEQLCSKITTDEMTEILRSSPSRSRSDIDLNMCGSSSGSPPGPPSIDNRGELGDKDPLSFTVAMQDVAPIF